MIVLWPSILLTVSREIPLLKVMVVAKMWRPRCINIFLSIFASNATSLNLPLSLELYGTFYRKFLNHHLWNISMEFFRQLVFIARKEIWMILKKRYSSIFIPTKNSNFRIKTENHYYIILLHTSRWILFHCSHQFLI